MADLITIGAWCWGSKYGVDYVEKLRNSLRRNITRDFRFKMFFPQPEDKPLTEIPGCFARLRAFDPEWQERNRITGRLVIMDLDMVVTGNLDHLLDRPEPFTILQNVNTSNPCPMNGSIWSLEPGYRPDVWSDFSVQAARAVPYDRFPDDQAWFAHKMPDAGAYTVKDGVYGFQKNGWPKGDALPSNACLVAFPGWRDPSQFTHIPWVQEHW